MNLLLSNTLTHTTYIIINSIIDKITFTKNHIKYITTQ